MKKMVIFFSFYFDFWRIFIKIISEIQSNSSLLNSVCCYNYYSSQLLLLLSLLIVIWNKFEPDLLKILILADLFLHEYSLCLYE